MKMVDPSFMRFLNQIIACKVHAGLESRPQLVGLTVSMLLQIDARTMLVPPTQLRPPTEQGVAQQCSRRSVKLMHCNHAVHMDLPAAV